MTLPRKTRQYHVTDVQIALPGILGDGSHPLQYLVDNAWRDNDTDVIVEEHILFGVLDASKRSRDFAH